MAAPAWRTKRISPSSGQSLLAWLPTPPGLLVGYGVFLAVVAFWPSLVDRPLFALVQVVGKYLPLITYPRVETLANVALFVPVGVLLTLCLAPSLRYLVMPIGFVLSGIIESVQALALPARTPSLYDITANTAGVCLGLLVVALTVGRETHRRRL